MNLTFFLDILGCIAWWGVIALSIKILKNVFKRNKNDALSVVVIGAEFIIGILGSMVLGDITLKKGFLFMMIFMCVPVCAVFIGFITIAIKQIIVKHNKSA